MLASSRKPCDVARLPGGRESPPYKTGKTGSGTENGRPPLLCCHPPTGAMQGGRFRPPQTRLPPPPSPAGVNARRGDLRHPGRVLARQGAAPLSRLTPTLPVCGTRIMRRMLKRACILRPRHLLHLAVSAAGGARLRSPLQGRLYRRQSPPKPPLQGEVDAPQGADGGVHCRLVLQVSFKIRQALAQHPQGTMLASSRKPCATERPQAAGEIARPTKPPQAGSNAQTPAIRQARWRADASIGPYAEVRRAAAPGSVAPCTSHGRAGDFARRRPVRRRQPLRRV